MLGRVHRIESELGCRPTLISPVPENLICERQSNCCLVSYNMSCFFFKFSLSIIVKHCQKNDSALFEFKLIEIKHIKESKMTILIAKCRLLFHLYNNYSVCNNDIKNAKYLNIVQRVVKRLGVNKLTIGST